MVQIKSYHRPKNVDETLHLLSRPNVNSVIVAGGTYINPRMDELVDEVIDLQAVGLDEVTYADNRMTLGAMVRLQTIVEAAQAPALLREMAHREGANTFRNEATVGGVVVGRDPESELLAGLLVFEAVVVVQSASGSQQIALPEFLANSSAPPGPGLVTAISLATTGSGRSERVARTPTDRPIVAAVARMDDAGQIHLALCGVSQTPSLIVNPEIDQSVPAFGAPC